MRDDLPSGKSTFFLRRHEIYDLRHQMSHDHRHAIYDHFYDFTTHLIIFCLYHKFAKLVMKIFLVMKHVLTWDFKFVLTFLKRHEILLHPAKNILINVIKFGGDGH